MRATISYGAVVSTISGAVSRKVWPSLAALAGPLAGDGHVDAVIAENAGKQIDVGKPRHVMQGQRLAGEKAGDHQRQRSVLGATDGYGAGQTLAADNADAVQRPSPRRPLFPQQQTSLGSVGTSANCHGRGEILRRGERIAFATADAKGEPIAEGGRGRNRWWRTTSSIQGNRLDGVGTAGGEPIDAIRRRLEHRHAIVLVAQPVDQCSAVDDDFDVFAGGPVIDGCR